MTEPYYKTNKWVHFKNYYMSKVLLATVTVAVIVLGLSLTPAFAPLSGYAFAQTADTITLTAEGSITDGGTLALEEAYDIAIYKSGINTYAAVVSYRDNGLQILDITDPDDIIEKDSITDEGTLELNGARDIAIYKSGINTYAAVASYTDDGVQILDITDPTNIIAKDSITDEGTLELNGAQGIAIFESDGKIYAAVVSYRDNGLQILDITDPDDIIEKDSITDEGTLELNGAKGIAIYESGNKRYAAVASYTDDGVQILDITDPTNIIAKDSITDDVTLELDIAYDIAIFESDGKIYAAVTSSLDHGLQILDITDPDDIIAKASITEEDDDTLELRGAQGIAIFESDNKRYAAVASHFDDGVQILDITDPTNIIAKDSITDEGTLELNGAKGIAIYESGNKRYAAVASYFDDGVQIIGMGSITPAGPSTMHLTLGSNVPVAFEYTIVDTTTPADSVTNQVTLDADVPVEETFDLVIGNSYNITTDGAGGTNPEISCTIDKVSEDLPVTASAGVVFDCHIEIKADPSTMHLTFSSDVSIAFEYTIEDTTTTPANFITNTVTLDADVPVEETFDLVIGNSYNITTDGAGGTNPEISCTIDKVSEDLPVTASAGVVFDCHIEIKAATDEETAPTATFSLTSNVAGTFEVLLDDNMSPSDSITSTFISDGTGDTITNSHDLIVDHLYLIALNDDIFDYEITCSIGTTNFNPIDPFMATSGLDLNCEITVTSPDDEEETDPEPDLDLVVHFLGDDIVDAVSGNVLTFSVNVISGDPNPTVQYTTFPTDTVFDLEISDDTLSVTFTVPYYTDKVLETIDMRAVPSNSDGELGEGDSKFIKIQYKNTDGTTPQVTPTVTLHLTSDVTAPIDFEYVISNVNSPADSITNTVSLDASRVTELHDLIVDDTYDFESDGFDYEIDCFLGREVVSVPFDAVNGLEIECTIIVYAILDETADPVPVIILTGGNLQTIELGDGYTELGATTDDGSDVTIDTSAFRNTVGTYLILYDSVDSEGNSAVQVTRTVNVVDTTPPVITLTGGNLQTIELGDGYTDLGATTDDGSDVTIDTSAFRNTVGTYLILYDSVDSEGNSAVQVTRTVNVVDTTRLIVDVTAPDDITKASDQRYIYIDVGMADATGSHPPFKIFKNSGYDTYPIGETIVTWYAVDSEGNYATDTQTITVTDNRGPPKMSQPSRYSAEATGIMTPLDSTDYGVPRVYYTGELDLVAITDAPSEFPLGVTIINWTVTNSGGLSTTVSQQIYLKDTTAPTITAPPDMTFAIVDYIGTHGGSFVFSPNGGSGYIRLSEADYGLPTAYDAVGPVTISNDLSSSAFHIGENVITWVAVDGKQQVAYDTQTITIVHRLPTSDQDPVVDEPVVDEPVVDEPVVDEPVVDEPVVDEPVVDEPVVDEPVVEDTEPIVPAHLGFVDNFAMDDYITGETVTLQTYVKSGDPNVIVTYSIRPFNDNIDLITSDDTRTLSFVVPVYTDKVTETLEVTAAGESNDGTIAQTASKFVNLTYTYANGDPVEVTPAVTFYSESDVAGTFEIIITDNTSSANSITHPFISDGSGRNDRDTVSFDLITDHTYSIELSDGDNLDYEITCYSGVGNFDPAVSFVATNGFELSCSVSVYGFLDENDEPVVDEPVVDEPVVDEPVVDEPVVDEPVVDEPVVDEPVVDEPVVEDTEPIVPAHLGFVDNFAMDDYITGETVTLQTYVKSGDPNVIVTYSIRPFNDNIDLITSDDTRTLSFVVPVYTDKVTETLEVTAAGESSDGTIAQTASKFVNLTYTYANGDPVEVTPAVTFNSESDVAGTFEIIITDNTSSANSITHPFISDGSGRNDRDTVSFDLITDHTYSIELSDGDNLDYEITCYSGVGNFDPAVSFVATNGFELSCSVSVYGFLDENDEPVVEDDSPVTPIVAGDSTTPTKKSGGDLGDKHNTHPTFGNSWDTFRNLVDCGYSMDGICTEVDSYHVDYTRQTINTGTTHDFTLKTYAKTD